MKSSSPFDEQGTPTVKRLDRSWSDPGEDGASASLVMATRSPSVQRRGPFVSRLLRYPGKGGWTFAPIPKQLAPPVTRPWGRTPVRAVVDGVGWTTSIWRDRKSDGALLAVPARIRGRKGHGDTVTVAFTFEVDDD
jgi:hypothetical protein